MPFIKSKNVRFEYMAHNYTIDGVAIGDIHVRVSFNTEHKNLIGMQIIRNLYTKIFCMEEHVFIIAARNKALSDHMEKEFLNKK